MRVLATDIEVVKRMGLERWQDGFRWPVSDATYFSLIDTIWREFDLVYGGLAPADQDLLLTDWDFVNFIAQYLHAGAVKAYCRRAHLDLHVGSPSKGYYEPDWSVLSGAYERPLGGLESWSRQPRRFLKNLGFNRHLPLAAHLAGLCRGSRHWSLGSYSRLKGEYVRARGLYCDWRSVQDLLPRRGSAGRVALSGKLSFALDALLERLLDFSRSRLDHEFDRDGLKGCWTSRLEALGRIYEGVVAKERLPETLLITEVGRPLHRTAALAAKRRGTRTIGFHHGNDMGNTRNRLSFYVSYGHCTHFICPTAGSAGLHAENYRATQSDRRHRVQFLSAETSYYGDLWEKGREEPLPAAIKTVMVMGYPMNANRLQSFSACFSLFRLDLELRVIRLLKQHGYRVIYKMHPERKAEAEGLFDGLADRVAAEPFEGVYQEADALFFGYSHSSTFGFALCTQRPIFLLDLEKDRWNQEAYDLLRRRCTMVPASLDEGNRIRFDEDLLLAGLAQRPAPLDFSYVREFMFPAAGRGASLTGPLGH